MDRRRLLDVILWTAIAGIAGWAAARLIGLDGPFPLMQLMAFTPYVAAAALVPLAVALATRRPVAAVAAALVAVSLAACVLPRAIDDGATTPRGPELRVMSANLLAGAADSARVVELVRRHRVDVLAVQEFTPQGAADLDALGLGALLPHRATHPLPGVVGSGIYSRYPLRDLGLQVLPSTFGQARAAIDVPGADPVELVSVHPCAPAAPGFERCWARDFAHLPAATANGPVRVLAGDFNGTLDHSRVRRLLATGYRDAAATAGTGLVPTWPYDERWYVPGVTLDRVLADRRVGVGEVSVHDVRGSDHRAVIAELVLPKGTS
jgi:endonuclease/exonuclease/phosphatase (EEP) superfamily protein YafD